MSMVPEQYQLYLTLAVLMLIVCSAVALTGALIWYFDGDNRGNRRNRRLYGRRATDKPKQQR